MSSSKVWGQRAVSSKHGLYLPRLACQSQSHRQAGLAAVYEFWTSLHRPWEDTMDLRMSTVLANLLLIDAAVEIPDAEQHTC